MAINADRHANPCFTGDTLSAWSEVLDTAETTAPGVGALRLRLVATKAGDHGFALRDAEEKFLPHVLLERLLDANPEMKPVQGCDML